MRRRREVGREERSIEGSIRYVYVPRLSVCWVVSGYPEVDPRFAGKLDLKLLDSES